MTPVAGRITNTDDHQFVLYLCFIQRRLAPGIPVDGIPRVLPEVGAGFISKVIETGLSSQILPCPDKQKENESDKEFPDQFLILNQR